MPRKPPRHEIPNAAPGPLRLVQELVNTIDLEHECDWIADWLRANGVRRPSRADLDRARAVREALRELLSRNNAQPAESDPLPVLGAAARRARLTIDVGRWELVPQAGGLDGVLGRVLAAAFVATVDGTWSRLKACRNRACRWAFYDYSKNRSASWCSMKRCGNRAKTRAYRRRRG